MGLEKILNNTTILQYLKITIDGFQIIRDDIISVEIKQDFKRFGIYGILKIKDSFDIRNNGEITFDGENQIIISMIDFLGDKSIRSFKILKIESIPYNERFKIYDFIFMDEITYLLNNTYISKGFYKKTSINAFKSYMDYLDIGTLLETDKLEIDIIDSVNVYDSFVVPQDRSVLNYFQYLFKQENIRMWQDRNSFNIKEIIPSSLSVLNDPNGDPIEYSNSVLNNTYMFKIHDTNETNNNINNTYINKPIEIISGFGNDKKIINETINLKDVYDDMKLNLVEMSGIQQTKGEKFSTFSTSSNSNQGNQKFDIFDNYITNNELEIAVAGSLKYSNIGNIVNVTLKGNPLYSDANSLNDETSSGKYFVTVVIDKIIGDKFIQKMILNRVDE
jgi:hypothetical protein